MLGLEVSRLARNNTDRHRLLEICALTDTLILDADGIHDRAHFNDRLLLAGNTVGVQVPPPHQELNKAVVLRLVEAAY